MIDPVRPSPIRIGRRPERHDTAQAHPCPATVIAHLGFTQPTPVRCGREAGHDGAHHYEITWTDPR